MIISVIRKELSRSSQRHVLLLINCCPIAHMRISKTIPSSLSATHSSEHFEKRLKNNFSNKTSMSLLIADLLLFYYTKKMYCFNPYTPLFLNTTSTAEKLEKSKKNLFRNVFIELRMHSLYDLNHSVFTLKLIFMKSNILFQFFIYYGTKSY